MTPSSPNIPSTINPKVGTVYTPPSKTSGNENKDRLQRCSRTRTRTLITCRKKRGQTPFLTSSYNPKTGTISGCFSF